MSTSHACSMPHPTEGDERTCHCGQKWKVKRVRAPWKIAFIGLGEHEFLWRREGVDTDAQK